MANGNAPAPIDPGVLKTMFLGTAVRRSQILPAQNFSPTGPMLFILPNAGVGRLVRVLVNGTLSAGTAALNTGFRYPYSLFNLCSLTDPLGVNRIQATAYLLNRLSYYKRFAYFKPANNIMQQLANPTSLLNAAKVTSNPLPSTANAIATPGPTAVAGWFDLPISMAPNDPRGAFRLDVANGQSQVTLNPAQTLLAAAANINTPFDSATGTVASYATIIVQLMYYYWDPVMVQIGNQSVIPYPISEMSLIHELLSTPDSSGLTPGAEKLTTLATGREYYRLIQVLNNTIAGAGAGNNWITRRRFLIDGNIPTVDETWQAYLTDYFERYGTYPEDTEVVYNFMDRPWDSNRYGQLQTSLFISGAATIYTGATLETLRETLYAVQQVPA